MAAQKIKAPALDKASYDKFVDEMVAEFKDLEVSEATVHYMSDYSSSCGWLLKDYLTREWDWMVQRDPSNQVSNLMTTIEQSLQQEKMQDYKKQLGDIKTLLTNNAKEFEDADRLSFQNRLMVLSKQYQIFMEAELRSVQE
ncbi:MAG TPA: hypothetical protein VLG50_00350 [Candidatus Saccharimonadales bacterium]|nr:hypothetical protein [Candidatus Saccharimonadales bacterium]